MKVVYRNKEREEGKKAGKLSKITAYVFAGVSAVLPCQSWLNSLSQIGPILSSAARVEQTI